MPQNKFGELIQYSLIRVGYDSLVARKFKFDLNDMAMKAGQYGVYLFFFEDYVQAAFNPSDSLAMGFLVEVLTRSALAALVKIFRGKALNFKSLALDTAVDTVITMSGKFVYEFALNKAPLNGYMPRAAPIKQQGPPAPVRRVGPFPFGF